MCAEEVHMIYYTERDGWDQMMRKNEDFTSELLDRKSSNIEEVRHVLLANNIILPEDFRESCLRNSKLAYHSARSLGRGDVKQAIEIADFWKPAIEDTRYDYSDLVVGIIYRLFRIQCFAANNNPCCEALYIGRFAKVNKDSEMAVASRTIIRSRMSLGGKAVFDEI